MAKARVQSRSVEHNCRGDLAIWNAFQPLVLLPLLMSAAQQPALLPLLDRYHTATSLATVAWCLTIQLTLCLMHYKHHSSAALGPYGPHGPQGVAASGLRTGCFVSHASSASRMTSILSHALTPGRFFMFWVWLTLSFFIYFFLVEISFFSSIFILFFLLLNFLFFILFN